MTQNLEAILALFENGERRYDEDPAFKAVCDSLKMGLGVYAVLDHQLKEVERLRAKLKENEELLRRSIAQEQAAYRRNEEMRGILHNLETQLRND